MIERILCTILPWKSPQEKSFKLIEKWFADLKNYLMSLNFEIFCYLSIWIDIRVQTQYKFKKNALRYYISQECI